MKFLILEADAHYIHGSVDFTAPRGTSVALDSTDITKLKKATAVSGYQLERDIQAARLLSDIAFPEDFATPYNIGQTVSARRVTRAEIEGTDLILTSGTGAITTGTAADTALGVTAGRLRVKQGSDEIEFILRAQLTPEDSGNVRLLIERP